MSGHVTAPEADQYSKVATRRWRLPWPLCSGAFWFFASILGPPAALIGGAIYDTVSPAQAGTADGVVMFDEPQRRNTNNEYRILVLTEGGAELADYVKAGSPPKRNERVTLTYYYGPITGMLRRIVATAGGPEGAGK